LEITNEYQAKYAAWLLTHGRGSGIEKMSAVLADAKVDLNPHQINAAVFGIQNPFSKGIILADEVGLGKTIEAGIIITQKWAEEKRKIIIIVPSTLKRQWAAELKDKFYLPVQVVDGGQPFSDRAINIISYNNAYMNEQTLRQMAWDLAVFDEAHKLRNVYQGNVMAESIRTTFAGVFKLLLTATPLQNSLLELYGLVSIIDENIFGDLESFKNNYIYKDNAKELAERLKGICTRTLRRQVTEYIKYTDRYAITQEFAPTEAEKRLYADLTEYIFARSTILKNLPKQLIGMTLLKAMSSSPAALAATLTKLRNTLKSALDKRKKEVEVSFADGTERDAYRSLYLTGEKLKYA